MNFLITMYKIKIRSTLCVYNLDQQFVSAINIKIVHAQLKHVQLLQKKKNRKSMKF